MVVSIINFRVLDSLGIYWFTSNMQSGISSNDAKINPSAIIFVRSFTSNLIAQYNTIKLN